MGNQETIPLPEVTQRKWWCGGQQRETFSPLVFGGKDIPITTFLYRVRQSLLRNHWLCFVWTAPTLPGSWEVQWHPRRAQTPTRVRVSGWERREVAWLAVRERVWLCSLFLAMLLIRSGTLGDSFNLSLSQIQTSTSSYYNIWLRYGIVERLN